MFFRGIMAINKNKMKNSCKKINIKQKSFKKTKYHNHPKKEKEISVKDEEQPEKGHRYFEESDDDISVLSMDCEEYEKTPRFKHDQPLVRNLLPVKGKKGLIYRSEIIQVKAVNEEENPESEVDTTAADKSMNLVRCYAMQQQNLENLKSKVALLCTSIIEDPENNMRALKELITMLQNKKSTMMISEKTIISLSLLHVFSDVLPGYKIRLQEEMETKFKLKKETKKLLTYEQSLLRYYKKYVDHLQSMVQAMKSKKLSAKKSVVEKKVVREIGLVAVKCLCELLAVHFTFNYFKNIANILVPLVSNSNVQVTNMCCNAIERVFLADKLGESSLDLVRTIVKMTKERKFSVPGALIRTFLKLNLKEAKVESSEKLDMKKTRKKLYAMSRKERRQKKKTRQLELELRETEAQESVENVCKFHTQTLNKVFWVYFHVLKDTKKVPLISAVLEGLSNFAFLINLEFYDDLNSVLCGLMETGNLKDIEKLHCMHTLFTILSGQAESLNIDPHKIYCYMYQILLNLCSSHDVEQFELVLKCIKLMIVKRKKNITFNRILAFIKRLCTVSLQTPLHGTLSLLSNIRLLLLNVKGSDILLDAESMIGSGIYYPEVVDPEYCNAQTTALWEFHLLKKHYNPTIKIYSQHLLCGCPNQGRLCLPDKLVRLSPEETLALVTDITTCHKIDGFEGTEEPPKKKFKCNASSDLSSFDEISYDLSWKTVKKCNFANAFVTDPTS